ncbi:MAG: N-acetylmuramoyl-L-alanine amidase [Nitriliruptoraceae bacterium]
MPTRSSLNPATTSLSSSLTTRGGRARRRLPVRGAPRGGTVQRSQAGWGGRAAARLLVVATVVAVLVPLDQAESWTTPVTLSETISGIAVAEGVAADRAAVADGEVVTSGAATAVALQSVPLEAPIAFSAVGFSAPASTTAIHLRSSEDGEVWTEWGVATILDAQDGPDAGMGEEQVTAALVQTDAVWVGEARYLQLDVVGASPEDVEVTIIDSMHLNDGPVERHVEGAVGSPAEADGLEIVSRAQWGADESLGSDTRIAKDVDMGIVHHTAHSGSSSVANSYTREEAPGLVRAMHRYHTRSLGWADIGYNVLVDRFGTVYEGRKGGFTNGVIGAHAAGWNTGSFGVSVIGNFVEVQASAAAIEALTEVIAIKSAIHGIDPNGWTDQVGSGAWRPTIIGHKDVGQTSCPGLIHGLLPQIRDNAQELAVRFPDVESTSPHRGSVMALADAGVTYGCELNLYCPDDTLTRAQAASFMVRAFDLTPIPGSRFSDVRVGETHSAEINALAEQGWLIGYDDGTFRPGEFLTRGQVATLLSRSFAERLDRVVESPAPYPDVTIFHSHYDGIMTLAEFDIRGDCGRGDFCPNDPVQRDSTATFVYLVRQAHGLD